MFTQSTRGIDREVAEAKRKEGVESTIHKEKGRSRIFIKGREMRKVIKEVDKAF